MRTAAQPLNGENKPDITIAMAARNSGLHIADALASVPLSLAGSDLSYEVTLADGGSSDATRQIAAQFPHVRLISTADDGIYDGMNRAIAAARGRHVIILNADDTLLPGMLARAILLLHQNPAAAMVSGDVVNGPDVVHSAVLRKRGPLTIEGLLFGIPAINARLFRTEALRTLGPIRLDLGLGADREFLMRAVTHGARGIAFGEPLYFYRTHAGSATISNDAAGRTRIYRSDETLIRFLRETQAGGAEMTPVLRAFDALSRFKMRRAGLSSSADRQGLETSLSDLARGLMLRKKWRGTLSGY